MAVLLVSGNPDFALTKAQIKSYTDLIREKAAPTAPDARLSIFLRIQQIQKGNPTQFYEMLLHGPDHIRERLTVLGRDLEFTVSPAAFFQPNTRQAEKLYTRALELGGIPKQGTLYDLYCGTGTLGIIAAAEAKEVIGIELSPESSLDARTNAKRNGVDNIEVFTGDVGEVLRKRRLELGDPRADVVMVDPPRAGLDAPAIDHVLSLRPYTIVYISCNPKTQAENLSTFLEAGYDIRSVQPVDQFPHTVHVENIVVLQRG